MEHNYILYQGDGGIVTMHAQIQRKPCSKHCKMPPHAPNIIHQLASWYITFTDTNGKHIYSYGKQYITGHRCTINYKSPYLIDLNDVKVYDCEHCNNWCQRCIQCEEYIHKLISKIDEKKLEQNTEEFNERVRELIRSDF